MRTSEAREMCSVFTGWWLHGSGTWTLLACTHLMVCKLYLNTVDFLKISSFLQFCSMFFQEPSELLRGKEVNTITMHNRHSTDLAFNSSWAHADPQRHPDAAQEPEGGISPSSLTGSSTCNSPFFQGACRPPLHVTPHCQARSTHVVTETRNPSGNLRLKAKTSCCWGYSSLLSLLHPVPAPRNTREILLCSQSQDSLC